MLVTFKLITLYINKQTSVRKLCADDIVLCLIYVSLFVLLVFFLFFSGLVLLWGCLCLFCVVKFLIHTCQI